MPNQPASKPAITMLFALSVTACFWAISVIGTLNTTEHRAYHNYYDDVTRELVREKYRDDVVSFGYEF